MVAARLSYSQGSAKLIGGCSQPSSVQEEMRTLISGICSLPSSLKVSDHPIRLVGRGSSQDSAASLKPKIRPQLNLKGN